ncbi:TPA: hypothetical protein ACPHPO_001873 [Haemophilus influenzae]|uniref:hypothetical protein n=1 Tax=Haemophilus TaxID=724 RepID=UPI000DD2F38B|nr:MULTISPECIES: hypothetical protein [Haemophilus]DAQ02143.1 MAG TPA: hypothetical protein [Bacteriophage sp.]DAX81280.1 MAG TPA: hypothetical protein [Caudoviricetes sp.]MCK9101956.1 hypothetical protein [Haemophilus influenzae]MDO7258909.1 hypothetical protein [Haemophilus influenzae]MDO7276714.1 hypothetical protein [Haemophilus influenzae]
MKWLIDSFFDFLFDSMGIIFVIALIIGFAGFCGYLNTPSFPWGAVFAFAVSLIPLIYCIRIVLDKKLTREDKWNKLFGIQPK